MQEQNDQTPNCPCAITTIGSYCCNTDIDIKGREFHIALGKMLFSIQKY